MDLLTFRPPSEPPAVRPSPLPPPPPDPGGPIHTLAEHASLCAEVAVFPEAAEGIFQRHGLGSPELRVAVDAVWKDRLRRDPAAYREWRELYAGYHGQWSMKRPGLI